MIAEIREYFDTQIKTVEPTIKAWQKDVFGNNDLNKSQADKYYNLVIGLTTPLRIDNSFVDETSVILEIWSSYKRDVISAFDALYDKALCMRTEIIAPQNIEGSVINAYDVKAESIEPVEEDENDNTFKIRLSFTVRRAFAIR